jgi:signal transduction histidine kinase
MAIDFAAGGLLALSCAVAGSRPGMPADVPAALVLAAVIFLAVWLRRRGPVSAYALLGLVAAISTVSQVGAIDAVAMTAMAYVLYVVAVTSSRRTGIVALAAGIAEFIGIVLGIHYQVIGRQALPGSPELFALIVAWIIGYSVRQRRAYVAMMQVQAASSAVAEERLRIARELHDVVAHSMSVIAVQAGFGQYVIDDSPADARDALGAIQATSREALAELRRMLAVLRQQDGAVTAAPLAPECGLAELDRLVSRTCLAEVDVRLTRLGAIRDLPAGIDVSAYRIIQESLTNVVKHAGGGARCAVTVAYEPDALVIKVTDDGGQSVGFRGIAPPGGHGLVGMRERAHLCGGDLSVGPLPGGGFRVHARLPLAAGAPAPVLPEAPVWSIPSASTPFRAATRSRILDPVR